jgi:putative Mg2+ transporter-C (MgtC) family protein
VNVSESEAQELLKGIVMPLWCEELLKILLAAGLGAAIGFERQLSGKVAGIRTNMLICLGAAVLTVVSEHMGLRHNDSTARIAAQIVSGVGFLGAGVIIRDRGGIHGLTTAATIWLVASVGIAVGAGFYLLGVAASVLAIVILLGLKHWPVRLTNSEKGED